MNNFVSTILHLPLSLRNSLKKSYYPEKKRKIFIHRLFDNIIWTFKFHCNNKFYTLYGLDIRRSKSSNFIAERPFWTTANHLNRLGSPSHQSYYLRDKFAFYYFMKSHNLETPRVLALLHNGKFYDYDMEEIPNEKLISFKDFFVKDLDGQCASFVKHINTFKELSDYNLQDGDYILQERIDQNEEMKMINPCAINTLRIVTVNKKGTVYVLSSILRVGTKKSGNVDNWAAGGLAVGINEDGTLKKYGFYKPKYGTKSDVHPDTNVKFEGFKIPFFKEACDLACRAHKYFYGVHSIGWDIAITPNGPTFIEGNDNWEISLMQADCGGLKKEWEYAISDEK